MSKYREADRVKKWGTSIMNNLESSTGKSIDEWLEIAKTCPETDIIKQVVWLKKTHDVGQNRAYYIFSTLNGNCFPFDEQDSEGLVDALFAKQQNLRPLYEIILDYCLGMSDNITATGRKTFVPLVNNKKFMIMKPSKEGLILGFAIGDAYFSDILSPAKNLGADRATQKVVLKTEADFNDEVKRIIQYAASIN